MECWRVASPLHLATSCIYALETNKNLIPKFLRKKETTVFIFSYCFMGFLYFYNMTVGKCQFSESKIVKLLS